MAAEVTELSKKRTKKPPIEPEKLTDIAPKYVKVADGPFPPWPKGSGKENLCDIEDFLAYWRSLPAEFINRTNVYVHRHHPKLDRLQEYPPEQIIEMRNHRRRYPLQYIDKPAQPWEPEETRMAFLRRYGSGDYVVWLNDAGLGKKRNAEGEKIESLNLCKAAFKVWDAAYPPILDPSRPDKGLGILDWTYPGNASFVTELRLKGITPPGEKESDEVGNEVVKTLVDKVENLADKVAVHETDRLVDRIAERVGPQNTGGTVLDMVKAMKELQPAPAPVTADPMTVAMGIAQKFLEMKADNPMVELYRDELKSIRDELKAEREENRRIQTERAKENPKDNMDQLIERAEKFLPKIKELAGTLTDGATNVVHGRPRPWYQDVAVQVLPQLVQSFTPFLSAMAERAMRPAQQPNGGVAGYPAVAPPAAPAQLAPGQPAQPAPDSNQAAGQRLMGFLSAPRPLQKLQSIFTDFVKGTEEDGEKIDGSDFAYWVYDAHGEAPLKDARLLGVGNIMAIMKASPYWPNVAPYESKMQEFIEQVTAARPELDEPENGTATDGESEGAIDLSNAGVM